MPLLSLGLDDETREAALRELADSPEPDGAELGSAGQPGAAVPTHAEDDAELRSAEAGPFDSAQGRLRAAPTQASRIPASSNQVLPPEIEELRQKLTEKSPVRIPQAPLAASVDSLSLAERGAIPTFSTFKFGYFPARGMLYSTIGHELALFAIFFIFSYALPHLHPQSITVRPNSQDHIVYLPEVGGGSEGQKSPAAPGAVTPQPSSAAPAHASKGFAYPGTQAILSNPPNPTNAFQTIQRPLLVHPEPVKRLVPLPNIVQMAETRLPSDLIAPKPVSPHLKESPKPLKVKSDWATHRQAKFDVPVNDAPKLTAKMEMPKLPAAEQPLPEAPKVEPKQEQEKKEVEKPSPKPLKVTAEKRAERAEKTAAPPSQAQIARMEMHGKSKEPLLSLSPMPLPPGTNAKVPAGEARGRFAIAPGGTLNPNSLTPGKPNMPISTTPGMGNDKSKSPNAATEVASNTGAGSGHNETPSTGLGNANGPSSRSGAGENTASGNGAGGNGTGKGRGAAGKGAGANKGLGSGTGSGAGSGTGSGSFPGITIQGGENPADNGPPPSFTLEPQQAYNMTVVSTAESGGGLADYGVFGDEKIFTVYIPMKRTPEEADPAWTLQYAMVKDPSSGVSADQPVAPPIAVVRDWPEVPADLLKKYAQRQVVIYAVIDKEGKVSHVVVKDTPDPRAAAPIAKALEKWVFRPAQANNQPVAVKVLIGIPL